MWGVSWIGASGKPPESLMRTGGPPEGVFMGTSSPAPGIPFCSRARMTESLLLGQSLLSVLKALGPLKALHLAPEAIC